MSLLKALRNPIKRTVDIVGAGAGLVVLAPVLGAVWLAVRTKLGSPVIFTQERPGKHGETFTLYKFRSMLPEDPSHGLVTDEQRMTDFGRRLRSTSLDELPTLINVLKGDMSLVGPRPLLTEYLPLYSAHQARRHEVRPGITGLAQVSGRNLLSWEERFNLDVAYVDQHDLLLDIKILLKTVSKVFKKSGIEGEGTVTMTHFVGPEPDDGLSETPLTPRWQPFANALQDDAATLRLGIMDSTDDVASRYWVYFDQHNEPMGIGALSGVGGLHLQASILMDSAHHESDFMNMMLNRLIRHGKSYTAQRITLRLPDREHSLYRSEAVTQDRGAILTDRGFAFAFKAETES